MLGSGGFRSEKQGWRRYRREFCAGDGAEGEWLVSLPKRLSKGRRLAADSCGAVRDAYAA